MPRKLKVTEDTNVCVGNAMCEHYASNTFALNDDRQSMVTNEEGNTESEILEAAENCPVSAITGIDVENGETLFP